MNDTTRHDNDNDKVMNVLYVRINKVGWHLD